jgi:hypothetical protein
VLGGIVSAARRLVWGRESAPSGPSRPRSTLRRSAAAPSRLSGPGEVPTEGRPLPGVPRRRVEAALGRRVPRRARVHTGTEGARVARSEGADAVTIGEDVYFAPGRARFDRPEGLALLAHELSHVERPVTGRPSYLSEGGAEEAAGAAERAVYERAVYERAAHLDARATSGQGPAQLVQGAEPSRSSAVPPRGPASLPLAPSPVARKVMRRLPPEGTPAPTPVIRPAGARAAVESPVGGATAAEARRAEERDQERGPDLERLAEEVYRRIRERVRLERERHGW